MTEKLKVGDCVEIYYTDEKFKGEYVGFGKITGRHKKRNFPIVKYYDINCDSKEETVDEEFLFKISPSKYKKYLADWKKDCKMR